MMAVAGTRNGYVSDDAVAQISIALCFDGSVELRWMGDVSAIVGRIDADRLADAVRRALVAKLKP
jgi:hypothetical protein